MNIERTHHELAELLGVYALDAVDDEERAAVEAHLATCPRCAAEVADHREVAAQLANDGGGAPDGVWQRIVDSLEESPPAFDLLRARRQERSERDASPVPRRSFRQWLPLSAAAAVLVVVGLVAGVVVAGGDGDGDRGDPSMEQFALDAIGDPDVETIALRSPDERIEAKAVVAPDGSGFLLGANLPPLDDTQTYQLWGIREGAVISLGILGNAPGVVGFHMDDSIQTLAVTAEVAGGVEKSQNDAIVVGEIS